MSETPTPFADGTSGRPPRPRSSSSCCSSSTCASQSLPGERDEKQTTFLRKPRARPCAPCSSLTLETPATQSARRRHHELGRSHLPRPRAPVPARAAESSNDQGSRFGDGEDQGAKASRNRGAADPKPLEDGGNRDCGAFSSKTRGDARDGRDQSARARAKPRASPKLRLIVCFHFSTSVYA